VLDLLPTHYLDAVINGIVNLALFILVVLARRFVPNEEFESFLIRWDARGWSLLTKGLLVGAATFSSYLIIAVVLVGGNVIFNSDRLLETFQILIFWGLSFAAVALFEEGLFRGYLLQKLLVKVPKVLAIGAQGWNLVQTAFLVRME
jgi:membrane protease YdiL (CAAX protease family)